MSDKNIKLLVPVHLDAMVINGNKSFWKDLSLNIDNLAIGNFSDNSGLGYYLEKGVQQTAGDCFYKDKDGIHLLGVHLHWVLPAALRHGVHDKVTNSLQFPLVPNRWLVVRTDEQQQVKFWMVDSDYIDSSATIGRNWIKQNTDTTTGALKNIEPINIGRSMPFDSWVERNATPLYLTVTAPGNPDFGSSYMHCKNVFGFYDDMAGAALGAKFSYKVYGWFSDAGANPFAAINTKEQFVQKLNELSWSLNGQDKLADSSCPGDMVCHGNVNGVLWSDKNPGTEIPSVGSIKLGIGNSSSEALAALLGDRISGSQLALPTKLLAAFQYKLLSDNGLQDNSFNLLKKQMHTRSFNSVSGGTCWVIEKQEKNALSDGKDKTADETATPFNTTVSGLLNDLNMLQEQYDLLVNNLKSAQAQLYALKFKSLYAGSVDTPLNDGFDNPALIVKQINTNINNAKNDIADLMKNISMLKLKALSNSSLPDEWPNGWAGAIVAKYNNVKTALSDPKNNMLDFIVKEVPAAVFYKPADPAVVIDGLKPSAKYLNKSNILCRTIDQLATIYDSTMFHVEAANILTPAVNSAIAALSPKVPSVIVDLLNESFLFDPLNAGAIAYFINKSQGNILTPAQRDLLRQQITDVIVKFVNSDKAPNFIKDDKGLATLPESFSVQQWVQPWTPIFMEWGISWNSTYNALAGNGPLQNWDFGNGGNNVDYAPVPLSSVIAPCCYYGRTILSDSLVSKVADLNKKINGLFQDMQPMSQTLSGFNNQLLLRNAGVQLPILKDDNSPDKDFQDSIGEQYTWNPMANIDSFQPLRAGLCQLTMLRIVDAFGQVMDIIPAKDNNGNDISPSSQKQSFNSSASLPVINIASQDYFTFPPRIVQPARVRFDWMSAHHKNRATDADPATSPVCGWLLHNKMDESISVFDDQGLEIGELKNRNDVMVFEAPPGETKTSSINNATLNNVLNFAKSSPDIFNELIKQMDAVTQKVESKISSQGLTMMLPVGFPVAVASAQCTLELKDPPAQNQFWAPADGNTDFSAITYAACIGNACSKIDGLIASFISNNYTSANLPFLAKSTNSNFIQDINLALQTGKTIALTLLLDPRMSVNISSGILPSANYELPLHATVQPLKAINLRFLVAPVITSVTKVNMPLVQNNDVAWNWISCSMSGGKKTVTQIIPGGNTKDTLKFEPRHAVEGWLKINTKPV